MMLQALIEYADRKKLGDPNFRKMSVRWEVALDANGGFTGIIVPKIKDPNAKIPQSQQRVRPFLRTDDVGKGKANFLCDIPERALGMSFGAVPTVTSANRVTQFAYFKSLLRQAADSCPQAKAELEAVLAALDSADTRKSIHNAFRKEKGKKAEPVTFCVANKSILDIEELKLWWQTFRRKSIEQASAKPVKRKPKAGHLEVCLATGKLTKSVKTASKIRGVPNTQGNSANLISFDKPAFTSYGLKKALNAAVSPEADAKICGALEDLLEKGLLIPQRVKPANKSKQVIYVHWTRKSDEDPFDLLTTADEVVVNELLRAPLTGRPQAGIDANKFYLMSLAGNTSRIIVRDWLESTVPAVRANVHDWFDHLTIMDERDGGFRSNYKIAALLSALVRESLEELPPQTHAQLLHAALNARVLPSSVLAAAVARQNMGGESKLNAARIALIKLCIVRNHSTDRKEQKAMSDQLKQLDPNSNDIAYLCGQLFAVIGRLQRHALGKVGTSLAERTYGGVATRPASTLGPVFTKVPAYVKKANSRLPGSGTNRQKEIEMLCDRINEINKTTGAQGFPPLLDLEAQGRFALGYYSYFARVRATPEEAKIEEQAEELPADNE